jgi:hypothetical protein
MQQNHKKPKESRIKKKGNFVHFASIINKSKHLSMIRVPKGEWKTGKDRGTLCR